MSTAVKIACEPVHKAVDMSAQPPKEVSAKANKISVLAPKSPSKEISPAEPELDLGIETEREIDGIGMGVLKDGTPYLNQRGLARLCGVQNAHIGTISSQWQEDEPKPRIKKIEEILESAGFTADAAHIETMYEGRVHYCYPAEVCLAVLEYYAFDAGSNVQPEARSNFRLLAGSKLREMIYAQVGYYPAGQSTDKFRRWHERIELNHQSAPAGFFNVFNEAHTVIYELIMAGADIGEKFVPDISIGIAWSKAWEAGSFDAKYGVRQKYPLAYPDDHPQSKSNPQIAWCYPVDALGEYRRWLQEEYIERGKFAKYLSSKVKDGQLPPSVAQLAIDRVTPKQIASAA